MNTQELPKINYENICKGFRELLKDIVYLPYKPHGVSKDIPYMLLFKEPVEFSRLYDRRTYRLLARYPKYAVSESGDVLNTFTNTIVPQQFRDDYTGKPTYKYVAISDPIRKIRSTVAVHRLVAMAWVKNNDFITNNMVDHKDGVKYNNKAHNLRWVSNGSNQALMYTDNHNRYMFIAKNLHTEKVISSDGLSTLLETIGVTRGTSLAANLPVYKYINNEVWYITTRTDAFMFRIKLSNAKPGFGLIVKNIRTDEVLFYRSRKLFREETGINLINKRPTPYRSIFRNKEGDELLLLYIDEGNTVNSIDIYDHETGKRSIVEDMGKAALVTGVKKSTIKSGIRRAPEGFNYYRYSFRRHSEEPWDIPEPKKGLEVKITYDDGEVVRAYSWREASRVLGRDMKTIKKNIGSKMLCDRKNMYAYIELI